MFHQSSATAVNDKMDILWVIDNSSSMTPLQTNLTANFTSFIDNFQTKGYDFHMAVTTSDAYLADTRFRNIPTQSLFRDTNSVGQSSGILDILSTTQNLANVFLINATPGANGSGDERALSSIMSALKNNLNAGFLRPDSFMSVIILSDEDDFSSSTRPEYSWLSNGGVPDHSYSYAGLDTVNSYVSALDTLTNSTGATRRYNVNAIAVVDQNCLQRHVAVSPSSIVGQRYMSIAGLTNGITGSICDATYSTSLINIQKNIFELATQFYLSRTPVTSTIVVIVAGVTIPQDPTTGWTYNATTNSIIFHGSSAPASGSSIQVNFTPTSLNF
jgi:hypothetical protein